MINWILKWIKKFCCLHRMLPSVPTLKWVSVCAIQHSIKNDRYRLRADDEWTICHCGVAVFAVFYLFFFVFRWLWLRFEPFTVRWLNHVVYCCLTHSQIAERIIMRWVRFSHIHSIQSLNEYLPCLILDEFYYSVESRMHSQSADTTNVGQLNRFWLFCFTSINRKNFKWIHLIK